jgi:nitroreductase
MQTDTPSPLAAAPVMRDGRTVDALTAIQSRVSAAKLRAPGPSPEELRTILSAGVRAPDHGRLRPWRFLVIEGEAQQRFAEILAQALKARDPLADEMALQREREKALRAPTVIVVGAAIKENHPKIPSIEQVLAVGAAVENMALAAHALGYGSMWKTGQAAYDRLVKLGLGMDAETMIASILYIGTTEIAPKPRPPNLDGVVRFL